MTAPVAFKIQREDEQWYLQRSVDGTVRWVSSFHLAHRFTDHQEALDVLEWLQHAGHHVRLFGTV